MGRKSQKAGAGNLSAAVAATCGYLLVLKGKADQPPPNAPGLEPVAINSVQDIIALDNARLRHSVIAAGESRIPWDQFYVPFAKLPSLRDRPASQQDDPVLVEVWPRSVQGGTVNLNWNINREFGSRATVPTLKLADPALAEKFIPGQRTLVIAKARNAGSSAQGWTRDYIELAVSGPKCIAGVPKAEAVPDCAPAANP